MNDDDTNTDTPQERAKIRRLEQREDALNHQRIMSRYRDAGICFLCAAQAAYGSQLGFSHVQHPCKRCKPVLAALPGEAKAGGWKSIPRRSVAA